MVLWMLSTIIMIIFILMSIAFFTLMERKVLSLTQLRVGPNKTSFLGILQPILDGIKLLFKEMTTTKTSTTTMMTVTPAIIFLVMMLIWTMIPTHHTIINHKFSGIFLLILLGLTVYSTLISGIISSSKFGTIGSMRASAQTISYEISLAFTLMIPLTLFSTPTMTNTLSTMSPALLVITPWWLSCVAECNRAPFDFAEGESELISGFNLEYSSAPFVYIFLGEYGMMLNLAFITSAIFFSSSLIVATTLFTSLLLFRSSYPRFRYDMLMKLCWLAFLPTTLFILMLIFLSK